MCGSFHSGRVRQQEEISGLSHHLAVQKWTLQHLVSSYGLLHSACCLPALQSQGLRRVLLSHVNYVFTSLGLLIPSCVCWSTETPKSVWESHLLLEATLVVGQACASCCLLQLPRTSQSCSLFGDLQTHLGVLSPP